MEVFRKYGNLTFIWKRLVKPNLAFKVKDEDGNVLRETYYLPANPMEIATPSKKYSDSFSFDLDKCKIKPYTPKENVKDELLKIRTQIDTLLEKL